MFLLKKAAGGYVTEIMGRILYAFASFLLLLVVFRMFLLFFTAAIECDDIVRACYCNLFLGNLRYI